MSAPGAFSSGAARTLRRRRSVIIGYHGVGSAELGHDPRFLRSPPERFRVQLEILLAAGFELLTVTELADRAAGGVPPPGLAALSFDDGMEDNHSILLPILEEYGVPATVYVISGLIGKPNPWLSPESNARMMTAAELRAMVAAGVELGAHTVSHPDLSPLSRERCLEEMTASRATIERLTGAPVTSFAYPFCRYGPAALAAARDAGFRAAVTCEGRGGWEPFELARAMITGNDGVPSFILKLGGAYQPLFDSVPGRAARTTTRLARRRVRALREHARSP